MKNIGTIITTTIGAIVMYYVSNQTLPSDLDAQISGMIQAVFAVFGGYLSKQVLALVKNFIK